MLTWTIEKPTKTGWYWFCANETSPDVMNRRPAIVHVTAVGFSAPFMVIFPPRMGGTWHVERMGGKWSGPIEEPT